MTFQQHFASMWWAYVVILVMICLSAYFSASEIAFNASNKMRLRRAADAGSKTAKLAHSITERYNRTFRHFDRKYPCEYRGYHLHDLDRDEPFPRKRGTCIHDRYDHCYHCDPDLR